LRSRCYWQFHWCLTHRECVWLKEACVTKLISRERERGWSGRQGGQMPFKQNMSIGSARACSIDYILVIFSSWIK
jgi:hypothetical protein